MAWRYRWNKVEINLEMNEKEKKIPQDKRRKKTIRKIIEKITTKIIYIFFLLKKVSINKKNIYIYVYIYMYIYIYKLNLHFIHILAKKIS